MPARSMATATISFGLVTVPVRLYAAGESSAGVSFNLLHAKCGSRLKQKYICTKDEEEVPRDQMIKGYEFAKDQYVTFTDDELKAMAEESSRTIDITEFVPIAKVDPIYFEGAYYLGPDKGGEKAYKLLAEAMKESGRCALAKWAARGKGYLALLRPIEGGLVMQILHYADEVRPFSEVPVPDTQVRDAELKLAMQLIDQISADEFHPENYRDEVRERYHAAIEQKVEGREVTAVAPAPARGQIVDLMEALKASLAAKGTKAASGRSAAEVEERKPARRAAAPRAEAKAAEARALRAPRAAAGGGRRKAG
ncbi:MAG TPA: Ku protein [Vicinamibacteria bacterium]|nr:Ku protein [Vicinamibacteria bacterium]